MQKLKKIFSAVLGIPIESITSLISPSNTPSWDSLNAIILITEIERGFGIKFGYDEAMAVKNFGDVITLVASKGVDLHE